MSSFNIRKLSLSSKVYPFLSLQELQCRAGGIPSTFRRELWRIQVTRCFYLPWLLRGWKAASKRLGNHHRLLFQHSIGWKWTSSDRGVPERLFTLGNAILARGGSRCFHALSDAEKVVGACLFSYWNHGSYPVRGRNSVTYFGPFFCKAIYIFFRTFSNPKLKNV